jgi:predicted membrane protein
MEHLNYVYPNEHIEWGMMIVTYPFLSGLVGGTFAIATMYYLFGKKELYPVAKLSLLSTLTFGAFAGLPLLIHLGHPGRAFFIMVRPNLTSAMAGFGFIYGLYMVIVCLEIWIVFRPMIIQFSHTHPSPFLRRFYRLLTLGVLEFTPKTRALDQKVVHWLAAIDIPVVCILSGYVGFIFGSLKANAWWSSPMTPLIFLLSAIVSGTAMLILVYVSLKWLQGNSPEPRCLQSLANILLGFLILCVSLELMEVLQHFYERKEDWQMLKVLMSDTLGFSFIWMQFILGAGIPLTLLTFIAIFPLKPPVRTFLVCVSSATVLVQVITMRFNLVIGGQLLSKSGVGLHEFHFEWLGKEGGLAAIAILTSALICLYILTRIFPPFMSTRKFSTEKQN